MRKTWCLIFVAAVGLCVRSPGPSFAFIDVSRPDTMGGICSRAQSITVLKLEKLNKEKGVFIYRKVADLKGEFPRDRVREQLSEAQEPGERKNYVDWAEEGKTAVLFRYENRCAICIGDQWTVCDHGPPPDKDAPYDLGTRTEPHFLQSFCGGSNDLVVIVKEILAGKEVVVPCMVGARDHELRERKGKLIQMRASLKVEKYDLARDRVETPKE